MNYRVIYENLIHRALYREYSSERRERHHIVPRSQGGADTADNLVLLTIREHRIAHLLLCKMGDYRQWFSVECFYDGSNAYRGKPRMPTWIRRGIHLARQRLWRETKRAAMESRKYPGF